MATNADQTRNGGLRAAIKRVAAHATAIGRLEAELAQVELKKKVASVGIGVGLAVGAALFSLFTVIFVFATLTAVLAIWLDLWLALLIMTVFLALTTGLLALIAVRLFKKGAPPIPEQAIREAKLTREAIRQ
ncbi:MAG TPA: phage holin family protein [Gaiellaceae bacterium]